MQTLNLQQGSKEWFAARADHFTASEAPAMLGLSKYKSRDDLLREKSTGIVEEVDSAKQRLFDRGHEIEAQARPIVEAMLGEDLYPTTGTLEVDGLKLLASFDGISMDGETLWENKTANRALLADMEAGDIGDTYWPQLEHQLLVSGAPRVYFTASDGTESGTVGMWYQSVPARRTRLIAGWKQFAKDLSEYKPVEVIPAAVAAPTEGFGALVLQVEGRVVACNIDAFRSGASAFLERLPKPDELNSDQDFANADSAAKACAEAEAKIKAAKDAGLAQMAEVDTVFRVADQIIAEIAAARIVLTKSVDARKVSIRNEIMQKGKDALSEHIAALNKRLGRVQMPAVAADFAGAIKGKRTIESLRNAVDTTLAGAKIAANEIADKMQLNLQLLDGHSDYSFLFKDEATLVMKSKEDLYNIIKIRISEHEAAEQKKLDDERARIRKEEEERAAKASAPEVKAEPAKPEETPATAPACDQYRPVLQPNAEMVDPAFKSQLEKIVARIMAANYTKEELTIIEHCMDRIDSMRVEAA